MFRHENGLIEFIGGHIEAGESIDEALKREAIISAPDHRWKQRHAEMMTAALAVIERIK